MLDFPPTPADAEICIPVFFIYFFAFCEEKGNEVQFYYSEKDSGGKKWKKKKYPHSSQGIILFNLHKWHCSKNSHIRLLYTYLYCEYVHPFLHTIFISKMNCFSSSISTHESASLCVCLTMPFINGNEWNSLIVKEKNWWNSLSRQKRSTWPAVSFHISLWIVLLLSFVARSLWL